MSNTPSFDDVWRLSRLGWLNSLSGIDSSITRPYTPLILMQNQGDDTFTVKVRGREFEFSSTSGLPVHISSNSRSVLANAMDFSIQGLNLTSSNLIRPSMNKENSSVSWKQTFNADEITVEMNVAMDYDGHVDVSYQVQSSTPMKTPGAASLRVALPSKLVRFANGGGFSDNGVRFSTLSI